MELKLFETPGEEWDEFATQYTDLIFYQSVWSEVLRKGLGGQPLYFYLQEGGEIVAGLPAVLLNFKIFKILYASIPYGNLIGEKSYYPPLMELLEKEFRKRGVDQVRLVDSPLINSFRPDTFQTMVVKCSLLELKKFDPEKIWESYRSDVRRAIRKAQKKGLFVKRAASSEEVALFYQLYLSSMKRNRSASKYPHRWFDAVYEGLIQKGKADILFAMQDDQYAAGVVLIYSSTSNHYLHNGSADRYLENRPNDLIVDWIIQKGIRDGKTLLDFMGSDPHDLPLIRFKEKWGSQSVDIPTYIKNYHPLRCRIWETGKGFANSGIGSSLLRLIKR